MKPMSLSKKLVFAVAILGVALGAGFGVSEVWGAATQVFQAGVQYEIDTDTAAQNLDITTKTTDGGGITLRVRHGAAPALYIDTANNVSIGGATPNGALDVGSAAITNGYFLDGKAALTGESADNWLRLNQSSSWTNGIYTPGVFRADNEIRQGSADAGAYGIQTSGAFYAGGAATVVGTASVGTPTAAGHATTKSYVDSAVSGVVSGWTDGGANVYLTTSGDTVSLGSNSASTAPGTKLSLEGSEAANRIVVDGGGPFIQIANRGWGGHAGILFSAYATSTYVNGGLTAPGNTWYRYAYSAFGGVNTHTAKAIIADHNSISFYIAPPSASADQPITAWNNIFNVTATGVGVLGTPSYPLHVTGTSYLNGTVYVQEDGTIGSFAGNDARIKFDNNVGVQVLTNAGTTATFTAGGNVGIGLTGPNHKLQVTGSIHTTAAEAGGAGNLASDSYDLAGYNIGTQVLYSYGSICAGNASGACNSTGGVTISAGGTVGTPAVAINASGASYFNAGNVGISDTTPTEGTLTVGGTGYFTGTVTVATPTVAGHAATKSYVDGIYNFGNVVVSGQTTVAADSQTDSLTLAAGTNVTITTNATTDTVTINASGGAGDIEGVTAGNQLTGGGTSGTVTLAVSEGAGSGLDADLLDGQNLTSASTINTVVGRDASGDINVRLVRSEYDTTNASIGYIMTQIDTVSNNYIRPSTPAQVMAGLGAAPLASPTFTGSVTMPGSGIWNSSGNVGIGVSPATGVRLDIASFLQVRSDNSSSPLGGGHYIRGVAGSGGHLVINANASVANTATLYLNYNGDPAGAGPVRIRETLIVNTDGSVNIGATGTNKLNAGTIDPIYTIGGQRYATYVPGMTGQKEETSGIAKLKNGAYVIDFEKEGKGSDLWLFAKTINLAEEGMDDMAVLLTPSFKGEVWYEKSEAAQRLVIHGDSDGEVSYRLTAPRFDHAQLPNVLENVSVPGTEPVEGFNLDKLLN